MMPPTPTNPSPDAIIEIKQMMAEGFRTMSDQIKGIDERLRTIEQTYTGAAAVQNIRISQVEKDQAAQNVMIKDLNNCIKADEERLDEYEPWVRGVRWLTLGLGASILALIWGILTHTVELVFH